MNTEYDWDGLCLCWTWMMMDDVMDIKMRGDRSIANCTYSHVTRNLRTVKPLPFLSLAERAGGWRFFFLVLLDPCWRILSQTKYTLVHFV